MERSSCHLSPLGEVEAAGFGRGGLSASPAPLRLSLTRRFAPTSPRRGEVHRTRASRIYGSLEPSCAWGPKLKQAQAPFSHFAMKLFLAAPASALPSLPTALVSQESAMHFFMKAVFAAPANALPSLPTALLSQVSCANAVPAANIVTNRAKKMPFMVALPCYR